MYIQYSEFRANSVCRASASCSKILNGKKYIQYSGKFHGKLCFPRQGGKNFNTVYSASKGNYRKDSCLENTTRKKLHPLELTSKVTTEFADDGTSRLLYSIKNVIAELKL